MKKLFFLSFLFCLTFQNTAGAQENASTDGEALRTKPEGAFEFKITEADFLAQAGKDDNLQEKLRDHLSLTDVNDDGVVSETEMNEMVKGLNLLHSLSENEKKETAAGIEKIFKESDADNDRLLNKREQETFAKKFNVLMIKLQFKQRDINGDGVIDLNDIPPVEDSMKKLDEALKRLDEFSKRMEAMSGEEMADNFLKNTVSAIAREDFYRMDKDGNGCVSANEYVDYELKKQERTRAEAKENAHVYQLTRKDYQSFYADAKKSKPDCMTIDEYVAQQMSFLDRSEEKTPEQRKAEFDLMDKNKDGKLTAEEYADYKIASDSGHPATKEDHIELFSISSEAEKKGYLTKDEFVQKGYLFDF